MVLLALLAVLAGQLVDGHVHVAPHGGVIAHAGARHIELLVSQHEIGVWVLDRRLRAIPPARQKLVLTLTPKGRPPQTVTLSPMQDHFHAYVDLTGLVELAVRAQLTVGTRTSTALLHWTPLDARNRLDDSLDNEAEGPQADPDLKAAIERRP